MFKIGDAVKLKTDYITNGKTGVISKIYEAKITIYDVTIFGFDDPVSCIETILSKHVEPDNHDYYCC